MPTETITGRRGSQLDADQGRGGDCTGSILGIHRLGAAWKGGALPGRDLGHDSVHPINPAEAAGASATTSGSRGSSTRRSPG